jgi:hypothetical protein
MNTLWDRSDCLFHPDKPPRLRRAFAKKDSEAPPPPDYAAAAQAQGVANKETAQFNAGINRPDEYTTTGSRTWTLRPGADPNNPQPGDWQLLTALSPEQQKLYDMDISNSLQLGELGNKAIGTVDQMMGTPFDMSKLPAGPGTTSWGQIASNVKGSPGDFAQFTAPDAAQQRIGSNSNQLMGDAASFSADRQRVADAMYGSMTKYYDDRFSRDQAAMETQLANQGLMQGSEAYDRARTDFDRNKNDAYQQAALQATLAGGAEQSRLQNELRSSLTTGQGMDLAANEGNLQSAAGILGLDTAANQGNIQSAQAAQGLDINSMQALIQALSANRQTSQVEQQLRGDQMQEQAWLRQLPLNEINAIRTGAQVNMPQFGGYYTGANAEAPPVYQAVNDLYGQQLGNSNAQQAASASNTAAAGTAIGMIAVAL